MSPIVVPTRVEISTQGWGLYIDTAGNSRPSLTISIKLAGSGTYATWYSAISGGTSLPASGLLTDSEGRVPGFIDEGSYDLTVQGNTYRVEATAGVTLVNVAALAASAATLTALSASVAAIVTDSTDVQIFNASASPQTWTKPAGAKMVDVFIIGAGSGGGSGRRGAAGTVRCGGGGGGGGGASLRRYRAALLGSTETVRVAFGTAGGAAVTANDTDGADGVGITGDTYFKSAIFSGMNVSGRGIKGSATGGAGGGGGSTDGQGGGTGGASSTTTTAAAGTGGGAGVIRAGGGGGGGGAITAGDAAAAGGPGASYTLVTGALGGTAPGGNGGTITPAGTEHGGMGGGGGAGGNAAGGAGGTGGAGAFPGGGGGGGGGSLNGSNSGAGGAGADGLIIVTSW